MSKSVQQTLPAATPRPFFGLAASYSIDPDNLPGDLANDAICLLTSVSAVLEAVTDGLSDDGSQMQCNPKDVADLIFGVQYQVQMTRNILAALDSEVRR